MLTTETALFYPNIVHLCEFRIEGKDLVSTNDFMCASHEQRHFIDISLLRTLKDSESFLSTIVDPIPLCTQISGRGMNNQRVLGMLSKPLKATYTYYVFESYVDEQANRGGQRKKTDLILDQVLVVDRLPVPFHLSIKRLQGGNKDIGMWMNYCNSRIRRDTMSVRPQNVPEQYRDHPYWIDDGMLYCGMSSRFDVLQHELRHASEGSSDSALLRSCAQCGINQGRLSKCGRCRRSYYCSIECQRLHWPVHRINSCVPAGGASAVSGHTVRPFQF